MEKNIGIWLDSDKAYIIDNTNGDIKELASGVEHFRLHGGAKGKTPYGAQDATSETALLERKKHQMKDYFKNIIKLTEDVKNIAVFGPAETKIAFKRELERHAYLKDKLRAVETADSNFTENQLREWVRNFYNK